MIHFPEFMGLFAGTMMAAFLASMLGLGGGFILVPLLALFFDIPMHTAIGTSLLCIIATSQSVALAKPSSKFTNLRLGIFLETFTVCGVFLGGLIAVSLSEGILKTVFGFALLIVFAVMSKRLFLSKVKNSEEYESSICDSAICNRGWGALGGFFGGIISSMLGVGGGIVKVPVLRIIMKTPFRVAVGTSNFMIGITAASGAVFYLIKGFVNPYIAFPCVIGAIIGAFFGGNVGPKIKVKILEGIFVLILAYLAVRMLLDGLGIFNG